MTQDPTITTGEAAPVEPKPPASIRDTDLSCRLPLLFLFANAAVWLLIGSVFALIASIKFHSPYFLADTAGLTYGRVRPASLDALVYGFCLQAGVAVAIWLLARLGRRTLLGGLSLVGGSVFWNLGVTVGFLGILAGDSTGYELFEMPGYSAMFLFLGWVLMAIPALVTFHYRVARPLFPSQWFIVAAVFWFPWIFSTASLLLLFYPVRGVAQSVISWWYGQNLTEVCLGMLGLGTVFFLVPTVTRRPLHSRYLALLAFGVLLLVTGWGGIPNSAPVPAWMPALSQVSNLLNLILILSVALSVWRTRWPAKPTTAAGAVTGNAPADSASSRGLPNDGTCLSFGIFATASFLVAGLMRSFEAWLNPNELLHFTWFSTARTELQVYGFFAAAIFGAAYYMLPRITGLAFSWPRLARAHYWVGLVGLVLIVLPFAVGGILQAIQLGNPAVPFMNTVRLSAHFLRVSTIGELLLLAGHVLFAANIAGLLRQLYRARVVPVYEAATEDLFEVAEGKA
ncbi:MAG TPA: cbb3-type cytochrome c oxidase subunit I [Verrucomicrobiae bacterium]